jgi:hypothetical protein
VHVAAYLEKTFSESPGNLLPKRQVTHLQCALKDHVRYADASSDGVLER